MILGDEFFMNEALKLARRALEEGEIPVGAVIVCGNKVVAKAYNQSHRLQDATAHAEMLAFTSASNHLGSRYLNDCTLYVTLEPCSMCAGASFWTQIGRVVFGAYDQNRGFSRYSSAIAHPKTEIVGGIMAEQAEALLKDFFKSIRK